MRKRKNFSKNKCYSCKYGGINHWNNIECWRFNTNPEDSITSLNASIREQHSLSYNKDNNCKHYDKKNLVRQIIRRIKDVYFKS